MLLGKLNRDLLKNVSVVSLKGGIKGTVTINDDEAELLIVLQ